MNRLRCALAWLVIVWYSFPGKLREWCGYARPRTEHYPMLRFFQLFGSYPVTITYPNPLTGQPLTLFLDLCRNTDLWYFRARARYEVEWLRQTRRLIRETHAKTFVDVGANLGVWSLTIAQACPSLHVLAIDPCQEHLAALTYAATRLRLPQIQTQLGVCNHQVGEVPFYDNPFNNGDGSVILEQVKECSQVTRDTNIPTRPVTAYRLDDLLTDASVVKIDVQGAEFRVLSGALQSLINGCLRGLICEVAREHRAAIRSLFDRLPQWKVSWHGGPQVYTLIGQWRETA